MDFLEYFVKACHFGLLDSTTSATEKAAQISQELNYLLSSNVDYVGHHSQTPSEAANAVFSPTDEVTGGAGNFRTTSHLSLPNSWQGNGCSSPSASSILIRELQVHVDFTT